MSTNTTFKYKKKIQKNQNELKEHFLAGEPTRLLLQKRVKYTDELLRYIWAQRINDKLFALIAVGGYGRGELHLASDIDLLILKKPKISKIQQQQLTQFISYLWDIGLEIGHSVRSTKECVQLAKTDITVITNLIESRLISGNAVLYTKLCSQIAPNRIWPTRKFFCAKYGEQIARHQKYSNTEHNLEPNIKESPGGLRDIQTIGWIAKRYFGASRLKDLITHGFLNRGEYQALKSGRDFLEKIRYALHLLANRREDRLLFQYQPKVAKLMGFTNHRDSHSNYGVELFMKMYYQTAREISCLNEILLQHFEETIVYAKRKIHIQPINEHFQIHHHYIEVTKPDVFQKEPSTLLEIFLQIQKNKTIKGIRANTARLIRKQRKKITQSFREQPKNQQLFINIIKQPRYVGHELRRMHRYGILGAYLPEFSKIHGQMQFDLFHAYTVDEHSLFVIQNMRRFGLPEYAKDFPLCHKLIKTLPKKELLYIAGLYHDIGKGRGGDHSILGAVDARSFCKMHGFNEYDTNLVGWLVEQHLLIPHTAQKEDLNDPDVIYTFAQKVGNKTHLDYLYLLAVADVSATHPELWNNWKNVLLLELYQKALSLLRRGAATTPELLTQDIKEQVLTHYKTQPHLIFHLHALWATLDDDYFLRHTADQIIWHSAAILKTKPQKLPLVLLRYQPEYDGMEIFIYSKDSNYIFASTTQAMVNIGLNIVDAKIITSKNDHVLDTYIVLETDQRSQANNARAKEIKDKILDALKNPKKYINPSTANKEKTKVFPIKPKIDFIIDAKHQRTLMTITANDRPGLLSAISVALAFCGARLQGAKIATYGERIEDIFYITDKQHQPIKHDIKFECLRHSIMEIL